MVITHPYYLSDVNHDSTGPFNTYFLESDYIIGPFKYMTYLEKFGPQGYFVNIPSKLMSNDIIYVNQTSNYYWQFYLSYSANWIKPYRNNYSCSNPIGSGYHWGLQQSRFQLSHQYVKNNWNRLKNGVRYVYS